MAKAKKQAAAQVKTEQSNGDDKPKKTRNPNIRYWVFGTVTTEGKPPEDVCLAVLPTIGKASKWLRDNAMGYGRFYTDLRLCRVTPVQPTPPRTRKGAAAD